MAFKNENLAEELLDFAPRLMDCVRNEMRNHSNVHWTVSQFRIVSLLSENKVMSNKDLAKKLAISPATLSRMIDILSDGKVLHRKVSQTDRRKVCFLVSPAGEKMLRFYRNKIRRHLEEKFHNLQENEISVVLTALRILRQAI